jgi:hypothetical protein
LALLCLSPQHKRFFLGGRAASVKSKKPSQIRRYLAGREVLPLRDGSDSIKEFEPRLPGWGRRRGSLSP